MQCILRATETDFFKNSIQVNFRLLRVKSPLENKQEQRILSLTTARVVKPVARTRQMLLPT
jgi:hypothetical protein